MNVRKTITTSALALGVLAGSAGVASAVTSSSSATQPSSSANAVEDQTQDPMLNGSVQSPEVDGQSEADESAALESLASITADDAGQAALVANPGATVDGVQLGNENGSVVFEVDMTDASGAAIEVKVDAGNGAVLAQESGDGEADDSTETDGIDHEFEGEETGENGDGVADADDANEAPEVAPDN
jgi:uncharacterized membrane protein YkoI